MTSELDRILDTKYWGQHGFPHAEAQALRETEPVARYEGGVVDPFWLITRHEDVVAVSRNPQIWTSTERIMLEQSRAVKIPLRSMVDMDPPEHTKHRKIFQTWLKPKNVRRLEHRLRELARELIDEMAEHDHGDFVEVATLHPLRMMCELLGIPREEEDRVLGIAKAAFGGKDPEHASTMEEAVTDGINFCIELIQERRARPTEDLASAIANATIDEQPIGLPEAASHLLVLITAGHDTTASAVSGGLLALLENPGELAKLQADPSLMTSAVEEMIRWVTPTTNFLRTATADNEIRGVTIPKGDDVCMSYASANRDAAVFEAPFEFRIDRKPNAHLGFGIGVHGCIGQVLARVEMQVLFEELIPRIQSMKLAGEPKWVEAIWIASLKQLPIRFDLKAKA